MLDIPEGAYGRTRGGEKVGPVKRRKCNISTDKAGFFYMTPEQLGGYYSSGRISHTYTQDPRDLVAIWQDGPVVTETVTKTRIVPGTYDGVTVGRGQLDKPNGKRVEVTFDYWATADELDAAAAVLSELAKGLRDA